MSKFPKYLLFLKITSVVSSPSGLHENAGIMWRINEFDFPRISGRKDYGRWSATK
jgi:hypothetical protein